MNLALTPRRHGRFRSALGAAILLTASLLVTTGVATAAPKPKPGICNVTAGAVTYSVRNTVVTGTTGFDQIDCSGSRKGLTIIGNGGGDRIIGTKAADVIWGDTPTTTGLCDDSYGATNIDGGAGNDQIHGGRCGGFGEGRDGDDRYWATGGTNSFDGGNGNDVIDMQAAGAYPGPSSFGVVASGGEGNDSIFGGSLAMLARGDEGNDHLVGGGADDTLEGGTGDDSMEGRGGNDVIRGDEGIDHLAGEEGDDTLHDNSPEADFFLGGSNVTLSAPMPRPPANEFRGWGDVCADADGRGTSPDDPDGFPAVGAVSAIQNDTIDGCEYLAVSPGQ